VINQMSRYAKACCDVDPAAFVEAMGWVSSQNLLARVTWKRAACTHTLHPLLPVSVYATPCAADPHHKLCLAIIAALGIYGTPQFMINGASSSADETWTLSEWRKLLDPLLL
jgi:hypothetical protein